MLYCYNFCDIKDNQVPVADRAVDQDGQGPARGAGEAQELPPPCQVHPGQR